MNKNIKLSSKITLGFDLLILLGSCLGGLKIVNVKKVEGQSVMWTHEYVPEFDFNA